MSKYKNIKEYLETCSEDEREYIYQIYFDMPVDELVDIIFHTLSPEGVIQEIEEYREEVLTDEENNRKAGC